MTTNHPELWAECKRRESERDISARILAHCVANAETVPARQRWRYIQPSLAVFKRDEAAYAEAFEAFRIAVRAEVGR